jgi:hypothetical protein
MVQRIPHLPKESRCIVFAALALLSAWSQSARAQTAAPAPVQTAPSPNAEPDPAPAPAAPPRENPGLLNEIGKLLDKPLFSNWPSLPSMPTLKSPSETIGDLNARTKDAGDALRLTTMVRGRAVCPVASNGAPDCKAGADKLCQSKGFKEGKSLDTDAAQSCSTKALLTGHKPAEGDCKTENYVTRALCQ